MKKKILVLFLVAIFLFSQLGEVYAKGYSGRSFSRSRSSISRSSSGYSGSSSSSSRSKPKSYSSGGYSGSSSSKSSSSTNSKTSSAKSSYMKDAYKKEASKNNYNAYKQKLNSDQKKVYDSTMNKSYKMNNKMNFDDAIRTRPQRINVYNSRPVVVNVNTGLFGSPFSYGYAYVGPWDLWFLMRASDLFWFNHWNDIYPYRDYFNAAQFADIQRRVAQLEAQGKTRDSSYLDPNVDPDLQLSNDYQQKHLDNIYYTNKHSSNPVGTVVFVLIIVIILIIIIRKVSKPKPQKPTYSRIY